MKLNYGGCMDSFISWKWQSFCGSLERSSKWSGWWNSRLTNCSTAKLSWSWRIKPVRSAWRKWRRARSAWVHPEKRRRSTGFRPSAAITSTKPASAKTCKKTAASSTTPSGLKSSKKQRDNNDCFWLTFVTLYLKPTLWISLLFQFFSQNFVYYDKDKFTKIIAIYWIWIKVRKNYSSLVCFSFWFVRRAVCDRIDKIKFIKDFILFNVHIALVMFAQVTFSLLERVDSFTIFFAFGFISTSELFLNVFNCLIC